MTARTLLKQPTAFLPLTMSAIAIATLLIHLARFGVTREADEGAAAHIWQLMMGLQVPLIALGLGIAALLHGAYDTTADGWLGVAVFAFSLFVFVGYVLSAERIADAPSNP